MSLESTLAAGQAAWLAIATDTCKVTRDARVGDVGYVPQVMNPSTLQYPAQAQITVYQGPCRVQVKVDINSNVVETTAGEREWTYLVAQLQVPVTNPPGVTGSVANIDVDHVCEVLTSPNDATLVGAKFNIMGPYHKSQAVYRRFRVREVIA